MFCPSCGAENTGLKYCNRCGANLSANTPPEIVLVNLTKPAVLIGIILSFLTLGGFGILVAGARMLASVVRGEDPVIALIVLGMATILIVDIILLRQLTKLISAALKTDGTRLSAPATQAPQLPRPATQFIPAASVTENTTRFLENDYRAPAEPQPATKREPN